MIKLETFNYRTKQLEVIAEVCARTVANAIREPEVAAEVLGAFCNSCFAGREQGRVIGELLGAYHPTIQHLIVDEVLGILEGLARVQVTDPRNHDAIEAAKKVAKMKLSVGPLV